MLKPMDTAPDINAQVSATVRSLLGYRRTSPEVLRHALGMSTATWHRRLKGERDWTAAEVGLLARFFEVPVQLLYDGPSELRGSGGHPGGGVSKTAFSPLRRRVSDLWDFLPKSSTPIAA